MGWLGVLAVAAVATAVAVPALSTGQSLPVVFIPVWIVTVAFPISLFIIAQGLFAQRRWARIAAQIYSVLAIFAVPVGTVVGFYVLWQLQKAVAPRSPPPVPASNERHEP